MEEGERFIEEFKEGDVYVVNNQGELKKCTFDPDDDRRKIRVRMETHARVLELQRSLRRACGGHKPDLNLVAEAALLLGLNSANVVAGTIEHCKNIFSKASSEDESSL